MFISKKLIFPILCAGLFCSASGMEKQIQFMREQINKNDESILYYNSTLNASMPKKTWEYSQKIIDSYKKRTEKLKSNIEKVQKGFNTSKINKFKVEK